MSKPQTFDIIAVSIPDSNVQKAVARIMVGADRYLSMQDALDQVKAPPVLLFKNTELKDAEQHVAKLKALGVGFRIVRADGADDDSVIGEGEIPGSAFVRRETTPLPAAEAALSDILTPGGAPPPVSVQDAISHHHIDPHGAHARGGGHGGVGAAGVFGFGGGGGGGGGGYGGGYGGPAGAAERDRDYGLDALRKSEEAARKKNRWVSIALAALVVVIALLFYLAKGGKIRVSKITIAASSAGAVKRPPGGGGGAAAADAGDGANAAPQSGAKPERQPPGAERGASRNSVSGQRRQQANNYVDSAKTGGPLDKQVAFYKIAVSFNRYNLQAWHGLLQAYREMNDAENVRATEAQMQEIFGAEVNSVAAAVTQFGELTDAYTNESGAYRVEYKTKKTSREEILRDVFNMTRAIRNSCNCLNISVYASTGPGNGLMVHSTAATPVHTLPAFERGASILWFE